MRFLMVLTLTSASFVVSCGSSSSYTTPTTNATTTSSTYADIASIIAAKCATSGCHAAGGGHVYIATSEANLKAVASDAYNRVNTNAMPQPGSPALTSDEKSKILSYLGSVK